MSAYLHVQALKSSSEGKKQGERKKRDTETKTHTERQRDTEILRLEEEPAESVISPGCVGRKLGRPWWWNPCKALTGCLRLSANRTAQWGRQCHHKSHFLRLSKNIALSVCIPLACPLSAKRNFPLHKNYSDISKTWNATNQDFPLRQLGNCGSLLPRHLLFAKESESLFLFNIKKKSPTSLFFSTFDFCLCFTKVQLLNQKADFPIIQYNLSRWGGIHM